MSSIFLRNNQLCDLEKITLKEYKLEFVWTVEVQAKSEEYFHLYLPACLTFTMGRAMGHFPLSVHALLGVSHSLKTRK